MNQPVRSSGNVLFIILIAVALFAALSYAITRQGSGTPTTTSEKNSLTAARLIQWGALASQKAQRMNIVEGIDALSFGFRHPAQGYSGNTKTYNCPVSGEQKCSFFMNGGGTLTNKKGLPLPPDLPIEYLCTGGCGLSHLQPDAFAIRVKSLGEDLKSELAYQLAGLNQAVCDEINKQLGISVTWPSESANASISYGNNVTSTVFPEGSGTSLVGNANAQLEGQTAFCYRRSTAPNQGVFVQVLIIR